MDFTLSVIAAFLIIFIIPVVVYGIFSALFGLKEPKKKLRFMLSVLVQKVGTSIGFVWLFYAARDTFGTDWPVYALIWFVMFALVEIGQSLLPTYSKKEAVAGIISEALYFPLAAFVISRLLT